MRKLLIYHQLYKTQFKIQNFLKICDTRYDCIEIQIILPILSDGPL